MRFKQFVLGILVTVLLVACPRNTWAVVTNTATQTLTAAGNGSTTNYTIGFDFRDPSQVNVQLVDTSVSPPTYISIAQGAGAAKFTITGSAPGTTVVMGTAPTTTQYLLISRVLPFTQTVHFDPTMAFPVSSYETQMDYDTMQLQQINAEMTTLGAQVSPMTTMGDLIYGGVLGQMTRLAGNTSSTKKFLTSTGNGTIAAAPAYATIAAGDVPTLNQNTTGNAATVTTNANMTGPITGTGNVTSITSQTGTGTKFVVDTSPTLVTPNLGTPSAVVLTNATGTAASLTCGNATNASTASTAADLSATLSIAHGGTHATTAGASGVPTVVALTYGATPALDASLGNVFTLVATGNPTIAVPTNPTAGQKIIIAFTASGGARTLALNTGAGGFSFGTTITALAPTVSGTTDYVGCIYNVTENLWNVVGYAQGF